MDLVRKAAKYDDIIGSLHARAIIDDVARPDDPTKARVAPRYEPPRNGSWSFKFVGHDGDRDVYEALDQYGYSFGYRYVDGFMDGETYGHWEGDPTTLTLGTPYPRWPEPVWPDHDAHSVTFTFVGWDGDRDVYRMTYHGSDEGYRTTTAEKNGRKYDFHYRVDEKNIVRA